jgi:hypothetical protein
MAKNPPYKQAIAAYGAAMAGIPTNLPTAAPLSTRSKSANCPIFKFKQVGQPYLTKLY